MGIHFVGSKLKWWYDILLDVIKTLLTKLYKPSSHQSKPFLYINKTKTKISLHLVYSDDNYLSLICPPLIIIAMIHHQTYHSKTQLIGLLLTSFFFFLFMCKIITRVTRLTSHNQSLINLLVCFQCYGSIFAFGISVSI